LLSVACLSLLGAGPVPQPCVVEPAPAVWRGAAPVLRTPGITLGFGIESFQNYYHPRPDSFGLYGVPASTYGPPGSFIVYPRCK
jgi:hypothetical protein